MNDKIKVLELIINDRAEDVIRFGGKPFNGEIVAEYFASQGAAIAALANIVKSVIEAQK